LAEDLFVEDFVTVETHRLKHTNLFNKRLLSTIFGRRSLRRRFCNCRNPPL